MAITRYRPELQKAVVAPVAAVEANKGTPAQRKTNAAASAAQPQRQSGNTAAQGDDKIDLNSLSEEEFDALPESVLAGLRGDLL